MSLGKWFKNNWFEALIVSSIPAVIAFGSSEKTAENIDQRANGDLYVAFCDASQQQVYAAISAERFPELLDEFASQGWYEHRKYGLASSDDLQDSQGRLNMEPVQVGKIWLKYSDMPFSGRQTLDQPWEFLANEGRYTTCTIKIGEHQIPSEGERSVTYTLELEQI